MDSISDLLSRIKNGYLARKENVICPSSKLRKGLLLILKKKGYVEDFTDIDEKREFIIKLKYNEEKAAIVDLKRVSKPGLRIYTGWERIPKVLNGLGICVLSTSKGLMTGEEARRMKIGGEIICKVW